MTLPIYVPALRLKQGEYRGLNRLARDVADKILPRLIIPPPKERDPEKGRPLTPDEIVYETGRRIAEHWPLRDALLDVQFLYNEFGETESRRWLPRIFEVARSSGAKPIPLASLSDTELPRVVGLRSSFATSGGIKIGIRIEYGQFDDELSGRVGSAMTVLGITPEDCSVLVDFADADFSNVDAVAEVTQAAIEELQNIGRWHQIIFQGTNYPARNPAAPGATEAVPRNEWLAWKRATTFDANSSDHMIFGDYGADCAEFSFGQTGGIPIRHYRYTTEESWLIVRGSRSGETSAAMKDVCQRILTSGKFAGREFSYADNYIFKTANGWDGPGNGTTWREINTNHHITRAVRDIGTIKGLGFADIRVSDPLDQLSLFAR